MAELAAELGARHQARTVACSGTAAGKPPTGPERGPSCYVSAVEAAEKHLRGKHFTACAEVCTSALHDLTRCTDHGLGVAQLTAVAHELLWLRGLSHLGRRDLQRARDDVVVSQPMAPSDRKALVVASCVRHLDRLQQLRARAAASAAPGAAAHAPKEVPAAAPSAGAVPATAAAPAATAATAAPTAARPNAAAAAAAAAGARRVRDGECCYPPTVETTQLGCPNDNSPPGCPSPVHVLPPRKRLKQQAIELLHGIGLYQSDSSLSSQTATL